MTKESLMAMGLTEEQAVKVMEGLNGAFVTKARFNEVNTELKQARETIGERDAQLEALQRSTGDAEALKKQIGDLQAANAEQQKTHEAELKAAKVNNAVEVALITTRAKNNIAVKALLSDFIAKAELAEDGTVKGLSEEVKKLLEGKDTAFLFETGDPKAQQKFKGARAAEKSDGDFGTMTLEKLQKLHPAQRYQFSVSHPDEYKQLYDDHLHARQA